MTTWRRHHGNELTANVFVTAPGAYLAVACHEPSGVLRHLPNIFRSLDSAKAAADGLVRKSFKHTCTLESCGEWLIWRA